MMVRASDTLNGFVDSGCKITGELEFSNSFRVDGRVEGTIRSRSELVIGEDGGVEGEIDVAPRRRWCSTPRPRSGARSTPRRW